MSELLPQINSSRINVWISYNVTILHCVVIHISLLIILWHAEHTTVDIRLVSSINTTAIYVCGKISLAIMDIEEDSHDSVPK